MTALIFDKAFELLMINEGKYVNDPHDKGGETKYGISKRAYPNEDIENLTLDRAKYLYKRDYWDRCKCDNLPDALSVAVFDFAVNSGTKRAIKYLQMAITGITVDGIIGNQTICAANRLPVKKVLNEYLDLRLSYLTNLKDWKYFGNGWGKRVERVRNYCEELI
jgi:lysozyme family protein